MLLRELLLILPLVVAVTVGQAKPQPVEPVVEEFTSASIPTKDLDPTHIDLTQLGLKTLHPGDRLTFTYEPAPETPKSAPVTELPSETEPTQPLLQPQPIRQPEPILQPEPIWQPEPILQPEPIRQPEPPVQPEPILQPQPIPQAETTAQPEAAHPPVTQEPGQLKFDFQCIEGNGYYYVENECNTFIECKNNRPMKFACPDGLYFNPAAIHFKPHEYPCAYPSEVKCRADDEELTVGQANNGYSYHGTSNGRVQRPQPIYGQRQLVLPMRPTLAPRPVAAAPVEPIVTTAPETPAVTAAPAVTEAPAVTAAVLPPRPLYYSVHRPLLPPRPIRPAVPVAAPPQPPATAASLILVTEAAHIAPPTEAIQPQPIEPVVEELQPEPIRQPEPPVQPEPILQPQPIPQAETTVQIELILQPQPISQPEAVQPPEPGPHPAVLPQRDATPLLKSEAKPINSIGVSPLQFDKPVALPPLIPKPQPVREVSFGRHTQPPFLPVDYHTTPARTVTTQPPPVFTERTHLHVLATIPSHPPVTQAPGQLKFDFQCIEGDGYYYVENECNTFIVCKNNRPMKFACPNGLHFNPAAIHFKPHEYPCAYPSEVKCRAGDEEHYHTTPARTVATQPPPVFTERTHLEVLATIPSHPPVTQAPGQLKFDFQCIEGNGYYYVEHECDTYVECKNNRAMKFACPDGLHFNPAAKPHEYPCAYPSEVKCRADDEEQSPRATDTCPNQYGYYSMNDGECSKYIMCQEGLATIMNCPTGLAFNPQTSSCDWPANVPQCNLNVFKDFTCPEPPKDEDGKISDIIYKYRYGQQCKQYIACQLGFPRLLSCDSGLAFDHTSQSCIDEDYVADCAVAY